MQDQDMPGGYAQTSETGESGNDGKALAALARALSDGSLRAGFLKDPHGTVGESYKDLPQSLRDTFESMSQEELDLFARTCDALERSGFYVSFGGGRVCFF